MDESEANGSDGIQEEQFNNGVFDEAEDRVEAREE